ncbi:hypothetical protein KPH14_010768 [Odynerus spinipes]|uniref:Transposase n=1 Tax=Odynerus spinipes TaxID=1348599 RepID=A0AAD9RI10_9HYME|nr:hypothetical protein KPH14_010768 [Odynerus spinipes]
MSMSDDEKNDYDERSGRPSEVDDDQMKAIIESNRHITVREIAKRLNVSHPTIENHIRCLGLVKKLDIWVPHELKEIHLTQRINICDTHFKRNAIDPFLKRIITGDEKWVVYNNINRKRSWSKHDESAQTISKAELHQKKIMLSIWWDYKGVVYFELLPSNRTINSNVCCQQLMKLEDAIKEKRPELANRKGIVFHHDNARPHTSLATRTKLLELGWEVMLHPPYSPDLAPSDYHLFRSLQNFLNSKNFNYFACLGEASTAGGEIVAMNIPPISIPRATGDNQAGTFGAITAETHNAYECYIAPRVTRRRIEAQMTGERNWTPLDPALMPANAVATTNFLGYGEIENLAADSRVLLANIHFPSDDEESIEGRLQYSPQITGLCNTVLGQLDQRYRTVSAPIKRKHVSGFVAFVEVLVP